MINISVYIVLLKIKTVLRYFPTSETPPQTNTTAFLQCMSETERLVKEDLIAHDFL
jgi:hypothetical protein